ncbi:hypothetical protein OF83DRAFT_1171068 [Amylostereum chailletii]|nr:hypothetical protein OF83DRAFT_1171068 [Amylostereum chailletii]
MCAATRPSFTFPVPTHQLPRGAPDGFQLDALFPTSTPTPTSCTEPDIAIVKISTALTISNWHAIYDGDIHSFRPTYFVTRDGSLVSPPLMQDLRDTATSLALIGAYLMFFTWTTLISLKFILRMNIKPRKKMLFYTLFASQSLGIVPWIAILVGIFNTDANCQAVVQVKAFFLSISTGMILSGVFGLKAYRCLTNSRFVLAMLAILQVTEFVLTAVEMVKMGSGRNLDGSCTLLDGDRFLAVVMIVIFLQAFFISCCFIRAVYTSSRILAAQGRLSFRASMEGRQFPVQIIEVNDERTRVWWDQIPDSGKPRLPPAAVDPLANTQQVIPVDPSPPSSRRNRSRSSVELITERVKDIGRRLTNRIVSAIILPSNPLAFLKPRVVLFREVMRDELCYTTVIATACVISAVLAIIGVNHRMFWKAQGWMGINLVVISSLAVHSVGRVVRRNEHEALLNNPQLWGPLRRASSPISFRPFTTSSHTRQSTTFSNLTTKSGQGSRMMSTSFSLLSAPKPPTVHPTPVRGNGGTPPPYQKRVYGFPIVVLSTCVLFPTASRHVDRGTPGLAVARDTLDGG